ncbi:MAG: PilZ domain-containing protein [Kofleriaceae bacterium]|nr:PilZ domain-containing protein [Kofleriaceae bacterium]
MSTRAHTESRIAMRFDKTFQVTVFSELFGEMRAIARNISSTGIGLEMHEPLPLGTVVTIRFSIPDERTELCMRAEVKHHYCFNYNVGEQAAATRGIGLRFLELLEDSEDYRQTTFTRRRNIH